MIRFCLTALLGLLPLLANAELIDIDNAELASLSAKKVPVIDIRTQGEWEETGIVPGSHLMTFFDERGRANPQAWLSKLEKLAKPGDPVILICRTGNRTRAVGQFLSQQAGYMKVYNVRQGIKGWIKDNQPITAAAPGIAHCRAEKMC